MADRVRLDSVVDRIRAKNAGPFQLTLDVFCGSPERFRHVRREVTAARVAELFRTGPEAVRCFAIGELSVLKYSLPRPVVQGHRSDRDMHGAAWAVLLAEMAIRPLPGGAAAG